MIWRGRVLRRKLNILIQGVLQSFEISVAGNLDDAELFEVRVPELHVEEAEAAGLQVFNEMDQANLGRIGFFGEHGLGAKRCV